MNSIGDCVSGKAGYHNTCSQNFRTHRQKPICFQSDSSKMSKKRRTGRTVNDERIAGFLHATSFLEENDDEPISISHLCKLMGENGCEAYSTYYMKEKLKEKYGEKLVINNKDGCSDIVSLTTSVGKILRDFYATPKLKTDEEEKIRFMETAGSIIRNDLKDRKCRSDIYDIFDGLTDKKEAVGFIPVSLQILLGSIIVAKGSNDNIISLG